MIGNFNRRDVLAFMPFVLFGGICWLYTLSFWPDLPYYDEWRNIPFVIAIAEGRAYPLSIFAPDYGYTVVWYRVATWIETAFFSYDPRVSIFLGLCFTSGAALIVINCHRRQQGWLPIALGWTSCALIFGLNNWENLLAPWLINSAATLFFMLVCLTTVAKPGFYWLGLGSAIFCVLSFANGLLIFPCAAFLLWMHRKRMEIIPFAILFVGVALYFFNTRHDVNAGEVLIGSPWSAVSRFFAALGAPYEMTMSAISQSTTQEDVYRAIFAGTVSFLATLAILWHALQSGKSEDLWVPFAIAVFGFGSCIMIAAGRAELGAAQATSSRYYSTVAIAYIGIFLVSGQMATIEVVRILSVAMAALVTVGALTAVYSESQVGPHRRNFFESGRQQMLNYRAQLPTGPIFRLPPTSLQNYLEELDRLKRGPFRWEQKRNSVVSANRQLPYTCNAIGVSGWHTSSVSEAHQ